MFPGGFLALGGSNTPQSFVRWAVRLAFGDDVDRWPDVVADEGDPTDLLSNRTTSFYDALSIFVSTPTLKRGRIDTLFERSDQRRYFAATCHRWDFIVWSKPEVEEGERRTRPSRTSGCRSRTPTPTPRALPALVAPA